MGLRTLAEPLFSSTFMKHLQEDEKSTANSIRMMSMQGGSVLGPWLGGQLMERASLDVPAYIGGGLYAVLAVMTLFLLRDTKGMIALKPLQVVEAGPETTMRGRSRPAPLKD